MEDGGSLGERSEEGGKERDRGGRGERREGSGKGVLVVPSPRCWCPYLPRRDPPPHAVLHPRLVPPRFFPLFPRVHYFPLLVVVVAVAVAQTADTGGWRVCWPRRPSTHL